MPQIDAPTVAEHRAQQRDGLIAALCERDMPRWLDELETAMAAADGPDAADGHARPDARSLAHR
jgi:hypothetical protein